jgi:hypothetical protein
MMKKNIDKMLLKETVGQSIMSTLRSDDPFIFDKWGAKNLTSNSSSFKFDTNRCEIIIAQNVADKKYLITFAAKEKGKRKVKHRITDIESINDILPLVSEYLEGM